MRKTVNLCLVGMMLMMHLSMIEATEHSQIRYMIVFDSSAHHETEVLQKVIETYHELTLSVKKSDHALMIRQHLDRFKIEDAEVSFKDGLLKLELGDKKGSKIEGDFTFLQCSVQIEEVSWLKSILMKEK